MKSFHKNVLTTFWLVFFIGISSAFATKYYVSVGTGSNSNTSTDAQSSSTPWQTVAFAITQAANGDSLVILPGTYGETNLVINKSLKLYGNEIAGLPGLGSKPIFNGTSGTANGSIFILQGSGIVLKNFEIQVNQADVIRGIFSNGGGFNNLQVLDNHIFSTSTLSPTVFNSYGIHLGTTSIAAGLDSFLIARNVIQPLNAASALFGRGIRLVGGYGLIGGELDSDSNRILGDYGIQSGDNKRKIQVINNHIIAISAAVELNNPVANQSHLISKNTFNPISGFNALSMIEIKNNKNTNSIVQISGNQFVGHPIFGILSTRSQNVVVDGNTFIPSDTALNYTHIAVNTKQQTTATDPSIASGIQITGNIFQGNSFLQGTSIAFQNHNSGAEPAFTNTVIGGTGPLANSFAKEVGRFLMLDTASGPSTQNPLWNQAGYKVTLMRPVRGNFDVRNNSFDLGPGLTFPAVMTEIDLVALEDRILHGVDYDSLGFVLVKDQSVFVTQTSFLAPFHSSPSLQRGLNQVGSNDGWTVFIEGGGTYPGKSTVTTDLTFAQLDNLNGQGFETNSLILNGIGKSLGFQIEAKISDTLDLIAGKILLNNTNLLLKNGADLVGGSSTSYIQTNANGLLQFANQDASARLYPLGTNLGYFPLTVSNSGVADQLGVRVQNDVLAAGLSGTPVDSVVNATWVATETVPGGSNLSISAGWSGVNEKPFFNRANLNLQGFSSSWSNISATSAIASGSDPYTASFTGITSNLNSLPIRVRTPGVLISGKLFYVDNVTGSDTRTNNEAKDPTTPWKTIANAILQTAAGDSIQVFAGTYPEFDLKVTKSLTILGNVLGVGTGPGAGTGVKPVINGVGPSLLDSSIFVLSATNTNIRNFNIKVDVVNIKLGINAPKSGFSGLVIEDNLIECTGDIVGNSDVVILSHAILLGRLIGTGGNGNDSIIVRRNTIDREGPTKKWFSRGIRWWGGRGMIGGTDPADGNTVHADFAVQLGGGNTGGRLQTRNNTLFGRAAGVEYNTPPPTFRHTIANNTIRPLDNKEHFALIEIKSNIRVTGPTSPVPPFIDIENNTLIDFYRVGVALTRSRKCNVVNNTFTPQADSTNYMHVWVNSKQRTAGSAASQPPLTLIETLIQGNTFNSNNVFGGYGVAFQNANTTASGSVFTVNDMGGAGALANTFGANIAKVVYLDTVTGRSDQNSFWSKPGFNWTAWPNTPMSPVKDNFDFSGNLYDVGTGSKRPDAMTTSELFLLENRVVHKVDADTLGFVTLKPNHVFVSLQSFISPLTTSPRIQRGVNSARAVDGFTVNIETGSYTGQTTVGQNMTFDASPDGQVTTEDLGMNGTGKSLLLNDPFRVSGSLRLENGLIELSGSDLSLSSAATVSGGSLGSHVNTSGTGYFIHENLSGTSKRFAVGTGTRYAETEITNSGTTDNVGLKVSNDVLSSGTTGSVVDTVVAITYQLRETLSGGSNLTFSPKWAASSERLLFNRNLVFVEQFNSGWQNIGPLTPSVATGTDPFSFTAPIVGNWNDQPIRIIGRSPAVVPTGNLYYVDDATGLDTRTNNEAKDPTTPWKTIGKALASTANQDSIQVFNGIYSEANLIVTKSVKVLGNVVGVGTGAGAGTGTKPIVNGTSGTPLGSIFILQADSVLIQNFEIRVNQSDVIRGIFSNGPGFNRLRVLDNHIFSTSTLAPSIFNSYGIQLGTTSIGAGLDSFLIARNVIQPLNAASALFGRGIRLLGGYGLIGGSLATDSNRIMGDYGIQSGDIKRRFQIRNNHLFGRSAAIELNIPAANQTHVIASNSLRPVSGSNSLSMIEIKNNRNTNSIIQITGNQFNGHQIFGVLSTRSQNVLLDGNTFIPSDTALNYIHVAVNTKQQTTATDASIPSGIQMTGNNFQGNGLLKGTAIAFQNHNSGAVPAFTNTVIGGAALLANTFTNQVGRFLMLDTASGPSTQNPLWNQAGYKTTLMRPVSDDFDLKDNLFDVGAGATLPSAMSEQNLLDLENRILHGVDYDSLGFTTVKDQSVFVTQTSFIAPLNAVSSLQRAINQAGLNDGWTLLTESGTYTGKASVSTNLTIDVVNNLSCGSQTLEMKGVGKVLTLSNDFTLSDSLKLNAGRIAISDNHLLLQSGAVVSGGSVGSYVQTNGTGQFQYANQSAISNVYPVGSNLNYFPLTVSNTGTADQLGIRVQDDVLAGGLTGTPVDSVVNATWVASENVAGGSNLSISATWAGANEKPFFNRAQTFAQGFAGSWANISDGPISATGSDPYTGVYANITSNLTGLPIRISSAQPQAPGNLYYVDNVSGLDTRTNAEAKNPATPWKTITKSLASTQNGDSIQVFSGNYSESNLAITNSVKLFGSVVGIGVGVGAGTGIRPIVNGSSLNPDSSIFTVSASNVLINNFQIEVDQSLIIHGILARTSNYDRVEIRNNRILSTGLNPLPPSIPCLRFNTYGIRLVGFGTDSLLIQGNEIEPSALDGSRCVFGRGIKLFGGHGLIGGPNDLDSNRILAYYSMQAGDIDGGRLVVENNFTVGIGLQIVAPAANSGVHLVRGNNFFSAFPQFFPTLLELKDIQKVGTGVLVTQNNFVGYSNTAIFSQRNQNVEVIANRFFPSDTARNYRDIAVNTKQETAATVQNPVPSSIQIKSNVFNGNAVSGAGTSIEFGNHNDDPSAVNAFTNVAIGGTGAEANSFNTRIGKFLVLDPLSGLSSSVPYWASSVPTPMAPVRDTFDISNNVFGVSGGSKLPSVMTDDELFELEDKVSHRIDYDSLGFTKWKANFAYVTDSSFLRPYHTSPSIQRAVDAATSDGWQVNIKPALLGETTNIDKSITFNTHPLDSIRLGGINMNGLDKTLTLSDKFILLNALTLNNPNGGKIKIGDNDLSTLPTAVVSSGSINSYVMTNGTGSLARRGVDDQSTVFPVGTVDSYAPVLFDDANNTGDNFKIKVKPAPTNADFTPALPVTVTTFVKFQWDICEEIPGGTAASLTFDWIDPSNISGSGFLNGISRNDGTNWNSVLATIGPGLTARGSGFSNFCSPFAVVEDPNLTTITTSNIIKVHPTVLGKFCVGDSVKIPFTVQGTGLITGNAFNAFLSDADGTFPVSGGALIGSLLGTTSDTIIGIIPTSTPAGLNYHIRVVSTNVAITGLANPDSIKVFGLPARPTISTPDSVLCDGESTSLTSSLASSYFWIPGGEITQGINVSTSAAYVVRISDANGCLNTSAVRNVIVNTRPVADTISYVQPLVRCIGDSLILTANPAGFTYSWLNTVPLITTRTLTAKASGSYQVVISNSTCSDTSDALVVNFNPLPVKPVVTLVSASVCQPDSLKFGTASSGFQYDWAISGITPNPTVQNPNVTAPPGIYTGTVTIADANGCKNTSDPITGTLKQAPSRPAISSLNGDLSICEGDSIQLRADPFSNTNTYTWQPGGFVGAVFVVKNPGSITVSVSVDSLGCSTTNLVNVLANVNPRAATPTVTLTSGQASFCQGDSAVLTSSPALGYLWTPGSFTTQAISVKSSGNYSVVALSDSGCSSLASASIAIDVRNSPGIPLISATQTVFCFGGQATVSVTNPIGSNTYTWTPSGTGTSIVATSTGNYFVKVDSINNCSSVSEAIGITVNPLPEPVITAKDNKTEACEGESVVLYSNYPTGNVWSNNATTDSVVIQTTLGLTLTVTDANLCTSTAGPVQVIIHSLPKVNLLKDTAVVFPETVVLVAEDISKSADQYLWSSEGQLLFTTNAPSQEVAPLKTARYLVTLVDTNGCKAVDSVLIRVNRELYVPNVFSPNGDGKNDRFKLYGFGVVSIEVKIWDRLGQLVYETTNPDEIVERALDENSVKGWDGTFKGQALGQESYIWSVKGKLTTGEDVKVTGGKNSGSVIIMN